MVAKHKEACLATTVVYNYVYTSRVWERYATRLTGSKHDFVALKPAVCSCLLALWLVWKANGLGFKYLLINSFYCYQARYNDNCCVQTDMPYCVDICIYAADFESSSLSGIKLELTNDKGSTVSGARWRTPSLSVCVKWNSSDCMISHKLVAAVHNTAVMNNIPAELISC